MNVAKTRLRNNAKRMVFRVCLVKNNFNERL